MDATQDAPGGKPPAAQNLEVSPRPGGRGGRLFTCHGCGELKPYCAALLCRGCYSRAWSRLNPGNRAASKRRSREKHRVRNKVLRRLARMKHNDFMRDFVIPERQGAPLTKVDWLDGLLDSPEK